MGRGSDDHEQGNSFCVCSGLSGGDQAGIWGPEMLGCQVRGHSPSAEPRLEPGTQVLIPLTLPHPSFPSRPACNWHWAHAPGPLPRVSSAQEGSVTQVVQHCVMQGAELGSETWALSPSHACRP